MPAYIHPHTQNHTHSYISTHAYIHMRYTDVYILYWQRCSAGLLGSTLPLSTNYSPKEAAEHPQPKPRIVEQLTRRRPARKRADKRGQNRSPNILLFLVFSPDIVYMCTRAYVHVHAHVHSCVLLTLSLFCVSLCTCLFFSAVAFVLVCFCTGMCL